LVLAVLICIFASIPISKNDFFYLGVYTTCKKTFYPNDQKKCEVWQCDKIEDSSSSTTPKELDSTPGIHAEPNVTQIFCPKLEEPTAATSSTTASPLFQQHVMTLSSLVSLKCLQMISFRLCC